MWYCTITTVCNYWWHVSHVNCKTHASGAEHQLSVLYQSVCVFNSKPVLFVNLRVRVCARDLVMTGSVLERVLWMCAISEPGLSPLLPCLFVVCIMLCCALHDIAVMICTLMSIYWKKETINKLKKKRLLSLTLVIVYTDTPVRNIKAVIYYTKRLSFSVNT